MTYYRKTSHSDMNEQKKKKFLDFIFTIINFSVNKKVKMMYIKRFSIYIYVKVELKKGFLPLKSHVNSQTSSQLQSLLIL